STLPRTPAPGERSRETMIAISHSHQALNLASPFAKASVSPRPTLPNEAWTLMKPLRKTLLWCRAWRRFHQEQFKLKHTRISAFITVSPEDPLLSHADEGITTRLVIMDVFQFIPCFG
ncbi:hypothetical protein AcV7_008704, partial [Taiwanofungus camphoratus]